MITDVVFFFSSFFLINTGIIFTLPLAFKTKEDYDGVKKFLFGNSLHIQAGFFGLVIFVLLLFFSKDEIMIFGDLAPALMTLVLTVLLLLGYIRVGKFLTGELKERGTYILESIQLPAGILGIITGLVHVFFGNILFL